MVHGRGLSTREVHHHLLFLFLSLILVHVLGDWTSVFQQDTASGTSGITSLVVGPTSTPLVAVKSLSDGTGYLLMSTNYIWKLDLSFSPVIPWGTNITIHRTPINGGIDFFVTKGGSIVVLENFDSILKLTVNGELDTNFGDNGRLANFIVANLTMVPQIVLVDDTDSVYVFGTKLVDGGGQHFLAYRLDPSGHYQDVSFYDQGFWEWTEETGASNTVFSAGAVDSLGDLILCATLDNIQTHTPPQVTLFKFSFTGVVTKSAYQGSNGQTRCNLKITNGYAMTVTESSTSSVQFFQWNISSLAVVNSWIPSFSFDVKGPFSMDVDASGSLLVAFKEGVSNGHFLRMQPGGGLPLTLSAGFSSVYPIAVFSLPDSPTSSQRFAVVADSNTVYYFANVYPCSRALVSPTQLAYLPTASDLTLSLGSGGLLMLSLNVRELIPSRLPLYLHYRNPDNDSHTYPLTPSYTQTILSGLCSYRVDAPLPHWYTQNCFAQTITSTANLFSSMLDVTWIENATATTSPVNGVGGMSAVVSRIVSSSFTVNLWLPAVVQQETPASFDLSASRFVDASVVGNVSFVRLPSGNAVNFHISLLLFTKSAVIVTHVHNSLYNNLTLVSVDLTDPAYNLNTWEWVVGGVCNISGTFTFDLGFACANGGQTCIEGINNAEQVSVTINTDSVCAVASASPYTAKAYLSLMNGQSVPTRTFQEADQMIKVRTWAVVSPSGGPDQLSVSVVQVRMNNGVIDSSTYTVDNSVPTQPVVSFPFTTVTSSLSIGTNNLQMTLLIRFGGGTTKRYISLVAPSSVDMLRSVAESDFMVLDLASPTPKTTSPTSRAASMTRHGPSEGVTAVAAFATVAMALAWIFEWLRL